MLTLVKFEQYWKAASPIVLIVPGIVTDVTSSAPKKQFAPISVTVLPPTTSGITID